ncbi:MAG: hypothetical protein J7502_03895 [Flavisolibacter sp.]|nr:hypothetical protein [Flavisolibacter sp.]
MSRYLSFASVFLLLLMVSCQKEKSFEQGKASRGSLQGSFGDCLTKTINGTYTATKSLADTNYMEVEVDVTETGGYTIYTDTVNGYFFRATGTFSSVGSNTVRLKGFGTPGAAGNNDFIVFFDTTFCNVSVTVLPNTGSSGGTAVYSLQQGTGGSCMNATSAGTYKQGVVLTSSNKITIDVNVTTAGTWNITTPAVAGFTFSGSGTFTTTGSQTITLTGSGTPNASGAKMFNVSTGASSCNFSITVAAGTTLPTPPNTGDYFPRTVGSHWTYMWNQDATDTMRWYVITPTKTVGTNVYNIFMADDGSSIDTLGYFRKSGGDYFQWGDIGLEFGFDNPLYGEVNVLKDNQAANFTWTSNSFSGTIGGQAGTFRKKYTITQKDVSITSNGISYSNTIAVKVEYQINAGPAWVTGPDYAIFFYTKNYGITKIQLYDATGTLSDTIELIDYRVF